MMLLASTDTPKFRKAAQSDPQYFGWFITPRKKGIPSTLTETKAKFAIDNDCFAGNFDLPKYATWLASLAPWAHRCLFAPCEDELGDWTTTLERFWWSKAIIKTAGFPVAIVLQDGATADTIPWDHIAAVFVGGTTEWKLSQHVLHLLDEAGARGKWRHVGRVNSKIRISHFWGHADSFDGSFTHKEPDEAHRRLVPHILSLAKSHPLPVIRS